jgi:hypothetical protein
VARQHIAATAVTAREALGEVREVATRYRDVPWPEAAPANPGELPAPRIARAVLAVTLCGLAALYSFFALWGADGCALWDAAARQLGAPLVAALRRPDGYP